MAESKNKSLKKPLAFKLMVDPKDVRRVVAMITGESLTDEELEKKFFDREPVEVNIENRTDASESFQVTAGLVGLMMAEEELQERGL